MVKHSSSKSLKKSVKKVVRHRDSKGRFISTKKAMQIKAKKSSTKHKKSGHKKSGHKMRGGGFGFDDISSGLTKASNAANKMGGVVKQVDNVSKNVMDMGKMSGGCGMTGGCGMY